ncbi:MAG: Zn-dependent exopeptidase M28, partial [Anaerolineae bacterium]|nr:Zn-dependent exopeptidase M28 [Anaerolineae bacterium]
DLRGKIAVLYGSLTQAPLTPKDFPLYSIERDQRIIALLEQKEPTAIITVNLQPPSVERLIEDRTFSIPSATVAADVGLKLLEREGQNAHLTLVTQRTPSEAANILGRKANKRPERIVICAHYDTKFDTPGAIDNGSGTAALLSLARILSKSELDISLEFVAFNDEEYFSQGDTVYANASDFSNILAAINLDGIGQRLGATTMAIMSHSQALRACVETVAAQYPGFVWVDPWPQSNHSTFAWRGVPSLALTSYFAGVTRFDHQPADSTRWVSSARLAEVVTFVREVVENIQHETLTWARPSVQP